MKRRVSIVAAAALVGLLLANSRASAQIVYQFASDTGTAYTPNQIIDVAAGATLNFRVYLLEGPPATQINSQGGLGTSGAAVTAANTTFGTFGVPNSTGTAWGSSNTAGSTAQRPVLSLLTFTAVTAGADGRVWLGNFTFTAAANATGQTTLTAADQNPGVGDNTSHFDPPFNGLDSLISSGSIIVRVPEPTSMALCGVAAFGFAVRRFRRRSADVAA